MLSEGIYGTTTKPLQVNANGFLQMVDASLIAKGYQQITSLSSAAGLTVPTGAIKALIQAESRSVRWRDDGTNPTTTVGMMLDAGQSLWYDGSLNSIKFIETSASAKLNVSYYG